MSFSDDMFLVKNSHDIRNRHLQARESHAVPTTQSITTPKPIIDVCELIPEFKNLAKTTTRLHARYGVEPKPDQSKMGGIFLWPSGDDWPICTEHSIPYAPVLQLSKSDFPEFPFFNDTDLMRLLWCPCDHDDQSSNTF